MSVDVRERLRRVLRPTRGVGGPTRTGGGGSVPAAPPIDAPTRTPARGPGIEDLVAGEVRDGPLGECFVAERRFPLGHVHGGERLGSFIDMPGRALGCLARQPSLDGLDPEAVVFLDTETTGLSGGAGTYVFMVGLGFFAADRFVVRQYFMRHHAEEPAMLALLNLDLRRFEAVVSFNGKAFDVPQLRTRFVQSRQRLALATEPHLDVLHAARRFWRDRLESCSLGTIEAEVLGHRRTRDVPSWMIPELYFRYVRGGDGRPMARVFAHNVDDVLSLAAVTCRLGRALGRPAPDDDAHDLFGVARTYEDLGLWDDACACYELALEAARGLPIRPTIAARLAGLCKRSGRSERAVQLWRRLALSGAQACEPYVELAKHFEHRARDYASAVAVVEQALVVVQLREARRIAGATAERAELEQRLARLLVKRHRAGF